MKAKKQRNRKCSAALAAGAGAVVCLSAGQFAGHANAAVVTGLFKDSNGGGTATGTEWKDTPDFNAQAFDNAALVWWASVNAGKLFICGSTLVQTYMQFKAGGGGAHDLLNPEVSITAGMNWASKVFMTTGTYFSGSSEKYYGVRFTTDSASNWHYGWWHIRYLSSSKVQLRGWGYESTAGAAIHTLADSLTTRKLGLTDGQVKLHWTNPNEGDVARYEVQAKDAAGHWQAVDGDAPGTGTYNAKVAAGRDYRLVVERIDGETEAFDF